MQKATVLKLVVSQLKSGGVEELKKILSEENINEMFYFKPYEGLLTPLHIACYYKRPLSIIRFLVSLGSDLTQAEGTLGNTCLHLYLMGTTPRQKNQKNPKNIKNEKSQNKQSIDFEMINYLVQSGSDLNHVNYENVSPFHLILSTKESLTLEDLEQCFKLKADFSSESSMWDGCLHLLSRKQLVTIEMIKYCVKKGSLVDCTNYFKQTPFCLLCQNQAIGEQIIFDVSQFKDIDFKNVDHMGKNLFHYLFNRNPLPSLALIKMFLTKGCDPLQHDTEYITPCDELKKYNIKDNSQEKEIIKIYFEIFKHSNKLRIKENKKSLNEILDIETLKWLDLFFGSEHLNLNLLKTITQDFHINLNQGSLDHSDTPLHLLCLSNKINMDCLKYLLDTYPEMRNRQNFKNQTPLHFALRNQNFDLDCVKMLLSLSNRIDCNQQDKYGFTPLNEFTKRKSPDEEIFRYLVNNGNAKIKRNIIQDLIPKMALNKDLVQFISQNYNALEQKKNEKQSQSLSLSDNDFFIKTIFQNKTINLEIIKYLYSTFEHNPLKQSNGTLRECSIFYLFSNERITMDWIMYLFENFPINVFTLTSIRYYSHTLFETLIGNSQITNEAIQYVLEHSKNYKPSQELNKSQINMFFHSACKRKNPSVDLLLTLSQFYQYQKNRNYSTQYYTYHNKHAFEYLTDNRNLNFEILKSFLEDILPKLKYAKDFQIDALSTLKEKIFLNSLTNLAQNPNCTQQMLIFFVNHFSKIDDYQQIIDFSLPLCSCHYPNINFDIIKHFIENLNLKINKIDSSRNDALYYFMGKPTIDFQILNYFVDNGLDIIKPLSVYQNTIMHLFCKHRDLNLNFLQKIIRLCPDIVNKPNFLYETPLHLICSNSSINFNCLKLLIDNDAKVHLKTKKKLTPLYYACKNPNVTPQILQLLISLGAPINNNQIKTPLHQLISTIINNHKNNRIPVNLLECLNLMLNSGADITLKDNNGKTPGDITDIPILKSSMNIYTNTEKDFYKIYKKKQCCDCKIKTIEAHKLILKMRTKMDDFNEIKNILEKHSLDLIKLFIKWVYGKQLSSEKLEKIVDIAKCFNFNIDYLLKTRLLDDLKQLWKQQKTKDYKLVVNKKDIPVHKIILLARSKLFKFFFMSIEEQKNQIEDYTGKSYESLYLLIKFLYTCRINMKKFNNQIYKEFFDVIDYYQLRKDSKLNFYLRLFELKNNWNL
ncbi:ankyrin repeat-containing protein [Anaeramoeba flamelloides]|uniref:Ankyrin repeat-containing protein n=1 Tax=Anaeramoeba flamelloides TaxID=1746091 RepID=A0AAV7ZC58_9EUKA|nr:ankyrin repeat-containing protein [Anaeramoeba flamelloides]